MNSSARVKIELGMLLDHGALGWADSSGKGGHTKRQNSRQFESLPAGVISGLRESAKSGN